MGLFFKKKKAEIQEEPKVEDYILKTEDEIKIDNELEKPLPIAVSEEEAFYRAGNKKKEEIVPYKARKQ